MTKKTLSLCILTHYTLTSNSLDVSSIFFPVMVQSICPNWSFFSVVTLIWVHPRFLVRPVLLIFLNNLCLYVLISVFWSPLRFVLKNDVWFVVTSSCFFVYMKAHVFFMLFVLVDSGVQHMLCCGFVMFDIFLCHVSIVQCVSGLSICDCSFGNL